MLVLEPNREGYRVCRVRDAACHQMVSRAIVTRRNGAVVSLDDVLRSDNRASNGRCGGSGCHDRRGRYRSQRPAASQKRLDRGAAYREIESLDAGSELVANTRCIDSDDFTTQVEQRAARFPGL